MGGCAPCDATLHHRVCWHRWPPRLPLGSKQPRTPTRTPWRFVAACFLMLGCGESWPLAPPTDQRFVFFSRFLIFDSSFRFTYAGSRLLPKIDTIDRLGVNAPTMLAVHKAGSAAAHSPHARGRRDSQPGHKGCFGRCRLSFLRSQRSWSDADDDDDGRSQISISTNWLLLLLLRNGWPTMGGAGDSHRTTDAPTQWRRVMTFSGTLGRGVKYWQTVIARVTP